jgi:hypothetical protein
MTPNPIKNPFSPPKLGARLANGTPNILAEGKRIVAARNAETQNARGDSIRLGTNEQPSVKREGSL